MSEIENRRTHLFNRRKHILGVINRQTISDAHRQFKRQLLDDIANALKKIDKTGNYGLCESCGKRIDVQRLKKLPEARFCVNCAAQKEAEP